MVYGASGRIGIVVPANNSVIEPELWPNLPAGTALFATRILAKGDLVPEAVAKMETHVQRAVEELQATGVDVIVYADMVTTFIMEPDWNDRRAAEVTARCGVPCLTAWTALRSALTALGVERFALGTPYPRPIHARVRPYFETLGYEVVADDTLDILAMTDVPKLPGARLRAFAGGLPRAGAQAIVLLATDLPTFGEIAALERDTGLPVLTSNQTILWAALKACGVDASIPRLGRLFEHGRAPARA